MHNHIIRFHKKKSRLIKLRCIKIFIQGNDKQSLNIYSTCDQLILIDVDNTIFYYIKIFVI